MGTGRREVIENFTMAHLATIRDVVSRVAQHVGLSVVRTSDLVVAVNEIAVNTIVHAGGTGTVTVEEVPGGVLVEVRDQGPGVPEELATDLPDPTIEGGRGLWLARRLCAQTTISNGVRGAAVRMFMPIA